MTEHRHCVTSQKQRNDVQVLTNEPVFHNDQWRDTHTHLCLFHRLVMPQPEAFHRS